VKTPREKMPETGRVQKRIARLLVLVHPHFAVSYGKNWPPNPKGAKIKLPPALRRIASGNRAAEAKLAQLEALYLFYTNKIDAVARKKDAGLAILRLNYPDSEDEIADLMKEGMPKEIAKRVYTRGSKYQARLVSYGRKLGNRLLVTDKPPGQFGTVLKQYLRRKKLALPYSSPIHLIGEVGPACVADVCTSLVKAGFKQARAVHSNCL